MRRVILTNYDPCDRKEGRRANGVGLWVGAQLTMDRNARKVIEDGLVTNVYVHIELK